MRSIRTGILTQLAAATFIASFAMSCSLASRESRTVRITFPKDSSVSVVQTDIQAAKTALASVSTGSTEVAPTALSEFSCFGVHISGAGIPGEPGFDCAPAEGALGHVAGLADVSTGAIETTVQIGTSRVIQVFAMKSSVGCPAVAQIIAANSTGSRKFDGLESPYVIGSATLDVLDDVNVPIKITYNPLNPKKMFGKCAGDTESSPSPTPSPWASASPSPLPSPSPTITLGQPSTITDLGSFAAPSKAGDVYLSAPTFEVHDANGNKLAALNGADFALKAYSDACATELASSKYSFTPANISSDGHITFNNVTVMKSGPVYFNLKYTTPQGTILTSACLSGGNLPAGPASQLAFVNQPANNVGNAPFSIPISVAALDAYGNPVSSFTGVVNLAFTAGTPASPAYLNGSATAATGVATFYKFQVGTAGTGYRIQASAASGGGTITSSNSNPFTITAGSATKLGIEGPTSINTAACVKFQVSLQDSLGNIQAPTVGAAFIPSRVNGTGTFYTDGTCQTILTGPVSLTGDRTPLFYKNTDGSTTQVQVQAAGTLSGGAVSTGTIALTTHAPVDLEVPIEMIDTGIQGSSSASAKIFKYSKTSLNPADYDGTVTYTWEIVATNLSSTTNYSVDLVNESGTTVGAINVSKSTPIPTRLSIPFAPGGATSFSIQVPPFSSNLKIHSARILVRQQGASKTRIYIPMANDASYSANQFDDPEYCRVTAIQSTSYTAMNDAYAEAATIWRKDLAAYSELDSSSPWTFEAILGASLSDSNTVYASLFKQGTNLQVAASEVSTFANSATLVSSSFSNNAANFDDLSNFEVRIRSSNASSYANLCKAGLWAKLVNLGKAPVYYRVARTSSTSGVQAYDWQRIFLDPIHFSNATFNLVASGFEMNDPTTANFEKLVSIGPYNSGTVGTEIPGSSIDFNSNSWTRTESATLSSSSFPAGDFILHKDNNISHSCVLLRVNAHY